MRYVLASEHRDYFTNQGHISFEDILPLDLIEKAETIVSSNARDLWRSQESIKQLVFQRTCARIVAELTRSSIVRIGFDQSLCGGLPSTFVDTTCSLSDLSCVQPILCGLMIRLTEGDPPPKTTAFCPFPEKRSSLIFFSPKTLITLAPLSRLVGQKFLLIAYIGKQSMYVAREKDPFVHTIKSLGYAFGDHLSTLTHPPIFSQH